MMRLVFALVTGFLFGAGLSVSQMANPEKVLSFLDITGAWDPSLLIVMAVAVATTFVGYRLVLKQPHPFYDARFQLPSSTRIDLKLIGGAALFGIGWAIAGYCPGPTLAALALGARDAWFVLAGILAGFWLQRLFQARVAGT